MLYYDRIDVSQEIDVDKTSQSKECDICHNWYFLNKEFTFPLNVFNGCHDLLMIYMKLSDIAILNIKDADYCCNIRGMSKTEDIKQCKISN